MNRKDELLAYLLKREGFERQSDYTIRLRDHDDVPTPLSFAQERFWFLDQFEHAHPVYNGCKVVRLVGQLRIEVLVECFNLILRRHEVLRTTYPAPEGRPIALVAAACSIKIPITDLGHVAESELPHTIERLVRKEWMQSINLSEELPIRARLVRLDHGRNLMILTLHQIAFDSRSVTIFFRELWTAYEVKLHGKEPELPSLPVQYADFASWQRHRVSGQTFQSQREYWIQRLSGILPVLNLPTDNPRPPVQGFDGARLPILLPETLQLKLKDLSRENGVTLFTTLLAAFKTLLYRYTAQEDLLVGCPVLNRGLPEIENLLGSFVNTLVLRTNYAGSPSFRGALRRVRETCVGAFAHQDFPFEKLVEELQPQRDLARNPIFQVMFAFQNTSVPALELESLRSEVLDIDGGMTKFDLTLSLIDKEHEIAGHIEYSTDLFHRDTIERMAQHFQTLLEGIAVDPNQSIATLSIMTEPERRQILFEWNDTAVDYPKDKCIHELFEEQVERTPDAIALECQDKRITYRELNRKANQLANYLISLGTGREKLVGICVERSIEMVVGLMGILKAGGAYVPIDPSYPKERLAFMLEDAHVSVLLTQESLVEDGRSKIEDSGDPPFSILDPQILDPQIKVVCLDRDWEKIAQQSEENSDSGATAQNLAYVIYTSGSTGQPKGVQIEHRSVINCLHSVRQHVELTENDVFLALTTISFDIAALELFLQLITGAKVVLASRDEALDGKPLLDKLIECGATAMQATPSAWKLLLDAGWRGSRNFQILCGGEVLSRQLADQLLEGGASLLNLYGPTETTIWSTIAKVEPGESPIPIGRPIANTQIYILDSHLQPVPVGVHGELYIGGDGLARGYLNRPELTAERFVRNPFSDRPDSLLYRTGDLARYRPGGNIEFLGRIDHQVKIRGHRIELGEIEAALKQHSAVKESVVVLRERDSSGDKDLVAYFVPSQDSSPSVIDLRGFLSQKVPEYMMPAIFIAIDALPLSPNGKVDRSKLPPPDDSRPNLENAFVEPRTEIEELVAQVWREVLKLEKVGVYDNFFDLGGHSLLATRVIARLRNNFGIDLPLRKLFELPTVAGLAEHIEILRRSENAVSVPPILSMPRDREIPVSFSQQRLWFLRTLDPDTTAYNMPSIFAIHGPLNVPVLEQAINAVIVRHEILRTVFAEKDGNPVQVILPFLEIAIPVIDLGDTPEPSREAKAHELALTEVRQPFDLRAGPLLRAKILALAEQEFYFLLNVDHMILDGTSTVVFFKEIAGYYEAFLDGHACALAPLGVQYADYAVWQRERFLDHSLELHLEYWKRQFGCDLSGAELPADHGRPPLQTSRGAQVVRTLSLDLTAGLKQLSRREGVTLFMTLLAAFDIILSRCTGSEDVVAGSTIAGRNRPEVENLIGFFINALPLRVDLTGNPSFTELLKRVREVCLDAYTHQDLPFEKIVEAVNPQRDLNRNPLFQILFNLADISDRVLPLRGCEVTRQSVFDREAKFDLTLYAPEKNGAIELAIVYNIDLFNAERVTAVLDQYVFLLDLITAAPEKSIDEYELVQPEAKAILPDPVASLGTDWVGAIHEMFSEQAERTRDRLAVRDALGDWTYGELERASNQLANYLIANGIKTEDGVAIYAQRGASLVVALLGVLKAGGVFTILDPAYPAARLLSYLRIARPKGWLQINGSRDLPEELSRDLETLGFECRLTLPKNKTEIAEVFQDVTEAKPPVTIEANAPAYIAFTSGSTGEAKGVLCRHGPITHFLPWQTKAFGLRENDRFALLSGLAYNHLHRDVFTPLAMGAAIYIPPPEIAREPVQLCQWLRENSSTVLHLTPALGQLLLTGGDNTLPTVRRIFFGGDVLMQGQVAKIRVMAPNATIGCFYGATETQRAVGYYEIPADFATTDVDVNRPIPLGRGIEDVQLVVLNRNGKLAGVGELGELYVRSPHLAQGYVNDETRTHEVFIRNPFTNDPEDRLYKTGELSRYLPDGNVEWAGRNDRRVSIRGFRVELEEIEAVLKQHPTVQNAAVVLREFELPKSERPLFEDSDNPKSSIENPKADLRLVAYVAADETHQTLADLLRGYVSTRLPEYMVPAHFVILEQLPLSPNGKVDYRALPPVQQFLSIPSSPMQSPQNEVEAKVSVIFSQVLGREHVGIEENFFRIGGHSLLAAQTAARIRDSFGVSLELRTFLESPTVAALAKHIGTRIKPAYTTPIIDDPNREEIEL